MKELRDDERGWKEFIKDEIKEIRKLETLEDDTPDIKDVVELIGHLNYISGEYDMVFSVDTDGWDNYVIKLDDTTIYWTEDSCERYNEVGYTEFYTNLFDFLMQKLKENIDNMNVFYADVSDQM